MGQRPPVRPLGLFSVVHLLLGLQPRETPLEKTRFLFENGYRLAIASGLVLENIHFSALGPRLVQTHAGPVHAASVSKFMCASVLLIQRALFSQCPPTPWLLHSFCLLFCRLWVLREGVWWEPPVWGLSVSTGALGFVFVPLLDYCLECFAQRN